MTTDDTTPRAVVPANVNEPDRIAFGLTFRQLGIIGGAGLGGLGIYRAFGQLLPPAVWIVAGIIVFCSAVAVALGRRDGLPLDVWLRHGLALSRSPRTPGTARASSVAGVSPSAPGVIAPSPADCDAPCRCHCCGRPREPPCPAHGPYVA